MEENQKDVKLALEKDIQGISIEARSKISECIHLLNNKTNEEFVKEICENLNKSIVEYSNSKIEQIKNELDYIHNSISKDLIQKGRQITEITTGLSKELNSLNEKVNDCTTLNETNLLKEKIQKLHQESNNEIKILVTMQNNLESKLFEITKSLKVFFKLG